MNGSDLINLLRYVSSLSRSLKKSDLLFQKVDLVDASSLESMIFPYKLKLESQPRCFGSRMTENHTSFSRESDDRLFSGVG
jgi:hypothetical protein